MKVNVLFKDENAKMPYKKYLDDFCYDVYATSEEEVAPNVWKYGIGLAMQLDKSELSVIKDAGGIASFDFRPRSSVWKTGMVLSNCVGTIDQSYTGEISAVFYHVMPSMPRYSVGDRIGQIKIGISCPIEFNKVDSLTETERGEGGYGSTGNK